MHVPVWRSTAMATMIKLANIGVLIALLLGVACEDKVVRPEAVPVDAVFVRGGKGGWWQFCALATSGHAVRCHIWNKGGLVLADEEFLPYDGGLPPKAEELKIAPDPALAGPDLVCLTNGRILLPSSRFDELKKFVDGPKGKSKESVLHQNK